MHDDAYIGGCSENNIECVAHDDLGWKNQTTRDILPHHWLYKWFSQFHSCGTYLVFHGAIQLYFLRIRCFGLVCQYLPNDWLERLLWGHIIKSRRWSPQRPGWRVLMQVFRFSYYFIMCLSPVLNNIFPTPVARYSMFVLKMPLNTNNLPTRWKPPKETC